MGVRNAVYVSPNDCPVPNGDVTAHPYFSNDCGVGGEEEDALVEVAQIVQVHQVARLVDPLREGFRALDASAGAEE